MNSAYRVSQVTIFLFLPFFALLLALPAEGRWTGVREEAADPPIPKANIVMIRKDGEAIDPSTPTFDLLDRPGEYEKYDAYIKDILDNLRGFCAIHQPCKIMFYFHGGLNDPAGSVERARKLTKIIKDEGIYPIFVNWDSSLVSTWWDHVAHVHKGLWRERLFLPAVPYFIAADEVRSIAEAPSAWAAEVRHTFPHEQEAGAAVLQTYQDLVSGSGQSDSLDVTDLLDPKKLPWLKDDRRSGEINRARAKLLYSWWSKILAPPLLIQAAGTGAWDMMQRRTAMLFRTEAEFRGVSRKTLKEIRKTDLTRDSGQKTEEQKTLELARKYDTGAAFARFIDHFRGDFLEGICGKEESPPDEAAKDEDVEPDTPKAHNEAPVASCEGKVEITLVGHSMGTIIIDRLLRYAPDLQVKNIVFMGAATTVEDYRDTVDAYLDRRRKEKRGTTEMYHLVLHPLAEVTEQGVLDLAPRGSLLIWIDNYFTDPPTPLGRRVGRFVNVVPELRFTGNETRPHVHLKVFRVGKEVSCWSPQKHGDFGDFPFWDKRFWDPQEPTDGTSAVHRRDDRCATQGTVGANKPKKP